MGVINSVKIQSRVLACEKVWEKDGESLYSIRVVGWESKGKEGSAMLKCDGQHVDQPGFGVGAWIQVHGRLSARQGKDGRWWGEATVTKLVVAEPAPEPVKVEKEPDWSVFNDEIPF